MGRAIDMENDLFKLEQRIIKIENLLEELAKPAPKAKKKKETANGTKSRTKN